VKEHATGVCRFCGETIKQSAKACPHCGSDEQTGWSEGTYLDGIDIGDEIDYEEAVRNEFSLRSAPRGWWRSWRTVTAGILLILFLLFLVRFL
jgi:hypothetical protein